MNQDTRTIEVEGHFGPKQITKKQFVDRWLNHISELHGLMDYENVMEISNQVYVAAESKFEEHYKKQQNKTA